MIKIFLDLLVIISLGLLGWGVIRIERIYQYPFFMGSMFISFLLPQAFALVSNPGPVSQEALERVLFMSCLCAAGCWIGNTFQPNQQWLAKLNIITDERKLFRAGIALMAQGYLFNFLLSRTAAQTAAHNGNWTGPATIYIFFVQVIYIAFAIFLLQFLKRPKVINFIFTIIAGWPTVQPILIGRRQPTMTFIIIVGISFWLIYRYLPPRWFVISAIVLMTLIMPVIGILRDGFWNLVFSGNWEEVLSASQKAFESQQEGDILELRNAALLMDGVERTGLYGYGTRFWDDIIFQYVPGQIVGYDVKESLQFQIFKPELLNDLYGYSMPTGTTTTGVGDSFMEFSYLGFVCFILLAYIFKNLWISSVYHKSMISSILYMGLVSPAMVGLTHGLGRFLKEALFQVIFVTLVAFYSRVKPNSYYSNTNSFEIKKI
jgi:hypothetical protein